MRPDWPVAWHIREWTPQLRAAIEDSWRREYPIRAMRVVPLASMSRGHPLAIAPPPGAAVVPAFTPSEWAIAACVDTFLAELGLVTELARGGCEWIAPPGFTYIDVTGQVAVDVTELPLVERGYPASLSLSAQLPPWMTLHEDSPLAVAIATAVPHIPVFVAIGNFGLMRAEGDPADLRNPIARLPGVVSVGATVDETGSALTPSSAVGAFGGPGPTLVADGENGFVDGINQSSFATPRAASCAALITAFLLQTRAAMRSRLSGEPHGVPLPVMGYVDIDFRETVVEQASMMPMLPFGVGIDVGACLDAVDAALRHNLHLIAAPNPRLVVNLLTRSAQPGPGLPHESGHGTISYGGVLRMLESLTWRELFAVAGHTLPEDPVFVRTIADPHSLPRLNQLVNAARLMYCLDYSDGSITATVRPPVGGGT